MNNRLCIFLIWLFAAVGFSCQAQPNNELGIQGGMMYYTGDLNPTGHLVPDLMSPALGIFWRYNKNGRWNFRTQFLGGRVTGDDQLSDDPARQQRNLSFESPIYELTTVAEFNFLEYSNFNKDQVFTPYLFAGLGFFWMEPTAELDGNIYNLRLYNTEGQAEPYPRVQFTVPFGAGFKFNILERLYTSIEWGLRKTYTDYMDDVNSFYPDPDDLSNISASLSNRSLNQSTAINNNWETQRGNSQSNDWYGFIGINLSIRLTADPTSCHFNPF